MPSDDENSFEQALERARTTLKRNSAYKCMGDEARHNFILELIEEAGLGDYEDDGHDQLLAYSRDVLGLGVSG